MNTPYPEENSPTAFRKFSRLEFILAALYFATLFFLRPFEYGIIKASTLITPVIWTSAGFVLYKTFFDRARDRRAIVPFAQIACVLTFISFGWAIIPFCGWQHYGTMYINKKDRSVTLRLRSYECLMTAGDGDLFEVRQITDHLTRVTEFHEKQVDTTKWEEVPFWSPLHKD